RCHRRLMSESTFDRLPYCPSFQLPPRSPTATHRKVIAPGLYPVGRFVRMRNEDVVTATARASTTSPAGEMYGSTRTAGIWLNDGVSAMSPVSNVRLLFGVWLPVRLISTVP